MPVGPSVDGKGWVNINNKCKCGHGMPLPESYGKYCSECGTRQPTWEEPPQYPGVKKNVPLVVSDVKDTGNFIPPLGQPYQLPDTRHRIGDWFYRTQHFTWVLSVMEDNQSEKMPMWVLDSTHLPEE